MTHDPRAINIVLAAVRDELFRVQCDMRSTHELYSYIKARMDRLWAAVVAAKVSDAKTAAVQVAAAAAITARFCAKGNVSMESAFGAIYLELMCAMSLHGSMRSAFEGYGVIAEEFDELWDDIKTNNKEHASEEAVQVAAMAVRFILDV